MSGKTLGSVALGLLISWLPLLCGTSVLELFNWSCSSVSNSWKLLSRCFNRHTLFFILNIVVLLLLLPFRLRSRPKIPDEDHSAKKLYRRRLQTEQKWKPSAGYGETENTTDSKRWLQNIERESLASAFVETDHIKCISNKPRVTDQSISTAKFGSSTVEDHNEFVKEELDDLHERIEAFIAKARRQMMLQEGQQA